MGVKEKPFFYAGSEPDSLVPADTLLEYSLNIIDCLFDRLVRLDPKTGEPIMNAAESITSGDQKVWTIRLSPGLTFHNGESVTARSFVDAWNASAYGPNGRHAGSCFDKIAGYADLNPRDENAKPKTDKLSGLTILDDTTFTVTLGQPFSQFPLMVASPAFAPMPAAAFADLRAYGEAPIGNGPFMMDGAWEHGKQIALKRFPGYRGSRPASVERVIFKSYPSRDLQFTDLLANKVDYVSTITAANVSEAKRVMGDRFIDIPDSVVDYLAFPLYDRRFQDPDLRRAISMAIDRQAIVNEVFDGRYQPATSIFPALVPGYRESNPSAGACRHDVRRARELFERAGGWEGTMHLVFPSSDPTYERWMSAVAGQLKRNLGITDIEFQKPSPAEYHAVLAGHQAKGPYRQNWYMDFPSPENYLSGIWGTGNRMAWEDQRFTQLVAQGNAASSLAESLFFYQQAEDVILEELPSTPLWNLRRQAGYSENVTNVAFNVYSGLLEISEVTTVHPRS
jgi:oligopeptide transport system substrate-binding protein